MSIPFEGSQLESATERSTPPSQGLSALELMAGFKHIEEPKSQAGADAAKLPALEVCGFLDNVLDPVGKQVRDATSPRDAASIIDSAGEQKLSENGFLGLDVGNATAKMNRAENEMNRLLGMVDIKMREQTAAVLEQMWNSSRPRMSDNAAISVQQDDIYYVTMQRTGSSISLVRKF